MLSGHKQFKISQFYDTFTTNHEKGLDVGRTPLCKQGRFFFITLAGNDIF